MLHYLLSILFKIIIILYELRAKLIRKRDRENIEKAVVSVP